MVDNLQVLEGSSWFSAQIEKVYLYTQFKEWQWYLSDCCGLALAAAQHQAATCSLSSGGTEKRIWKCEDFWVEIRAPY